MIKVLYFASMRERIGRSSDAININQPITIAKLWQMATSQDSFPDDVLIALNQEYTDKNTMVSDGDEVAFFPPVTGG